MRVFQAVIIFMSIQMCAVSAQNRYSTHKLQNLATAIGLKNVIDTLPDSCYDGSFKYKGHPLAVTVRTGNVEHIGYRLFSQWQRVGEFNYLYDFIERQILENDLNPKNSGPDASARNIRFDRGNVSTLRALSGDSTVTVSVNCEHDSRYEVSWNRGDKTLCSIVFPNNRELIMGSTMTENEASLRQNLSSYRHPRPDSLPAPSLEMLLPDIYDESLLMRDFGSPRTPLVGNRLFYTLSADSIPRLVFSSLHPVESVANILCSCAIPHDFGADVKLVKYNLMDEHFSVPLYDLTGYFLSEGCTPYFGVLRYDEESRRIECILEMHNYLLAYEHLMRIKINLSKMDSLIGEAEITLYPYIPTTNFQK